MNELTSISGIVFNIQRFSLHDGPGIRTTVFFKGCNLRCAWCHNPESFRKEPQISIDFNKCNACGKCTLVCPEGVHHIKDGTHTFNAEACKLCGACVEACPVNAISIIGKDYTAQEVINLVKKDRKYYERSGGGVTYSGGEATYQYEFLLQLLILSKQENLHVCLETNGMVTEKHLREISNYVDLFLYDFKHYDDELHMEYTGASNQQILKNLAILNQLAKPVILRCPIIPGINDTSSHFEAIQSLKQKYDNMKQVELMAYHEIGISKWCSLGYDYSLTDIKAPKKDRIEAWKREAGID
jgi:pyruvate formate lyase activating enzyme